MCPRLQLDMAAPAQHYYITSRQGMAHYPNKGIALTTSVSKVNSRGDLMLTCLLLSRSLRTTFPSHESPNQPHQ